MLTIRFRVLGLQGKGAFSQVYKCRNINTLEMEALKVTINTFDCQKQSEKEIMIHDIVFFPLFSSFIAHSCPI